MNYSLNRLYDTVGISKQAVHQYSKRQKLFDAHLSQLVLEVDDLRSSHPGCGVEKMYDILKPDFIGRDRFIEVFMSLGYRIKRQKNYKKTTVSGNIFYPDLIKGLKLDGPSQLWQSDITYIRIKDRFYYAVFIIDVYLRKIVGYHVSDNMRATSNIKALKMALNKHLPPTIHHSDRGSQYTYKAYTEILLQNGSKISMGLTAQENAYAERFHRTIKEEYLNYWKPQTFIDLKRCVAKAVTNYNQTRTHNNIGKQSPLQFEQKIKNNTELDKPILTIFDNNSISKPVNSI